ncbi:MAG: hypothetical protein ABIX46_01590 [Burkholderiaceae bacterium]
MTRLRFIHVLTAVTLAGGAAAQPSPPASAGAAASSAGWPEIAQVLRHPRCMNCHPVGEFPRQGDDRHRHQQLVMRGPDNRGAVTLQCAACHQTVNVADGRVPGAPNWHLAPLSMGWEGLDDRRLCEALKDPQRNGERDLHALSAHMTGDALVQWAWRPGARVPPSLGQADFHAAVRRWVAAGGPCPG